MTVKSRIVDPSSPIFIDPLNNLTTRELIGSIISGFGGSIGLEFMANIAYQF